MSSNAPKTTESPDDLPPHETLPEQQAEESGGPAPQAPSPTPAQARRQAKKQAKLAKLSNPKKLGFLRFIQVLFAINVILTISLLAFKIKGSSAIEFENVIDYLNLVFDSISFWLIFNRKKAARGWTIGFSLFNIIIGTLFNIAIGQFDLLLQFLLSFSDIVLFVYFLTSRRVKAVLTKPFSAETRKAELERDANLFKPRTWPFWRNLLIYFCVFSVVGHWLEAGYCTFIRLGVLPGTYDPNSQIWSDWLYPFVVYGIGAVACVLLLYPVKSLILAKVKKPFLSLAASFVLNALVCTLIELAMGLMLNQPLPDGSLPLWDYRNMFCNFMGQVCLQNALAFGVISTLMVWAIYPALEKLLSRLPKDGANMLFVGVVVGFLVLFLLYCINVVIPGFNDPDTTAANEAELAQIEEELNRIDAELNRIEAEEAASS